MATTNPRNALLSGLILSASADRLTANVGPGHCYLPLANGSTLRMSMDAAISVTLQQPSASTWQHLYAYQGTTAGTVLVEASTTAPSATYQGTARTKTGDTTRRFLGSIYVGSDSKIVPFAHSSPGQQGNDITYTTPLGQNGTSAPLLLGLVTTPTTFDCSSFVPPNVAMLKAQLINSAATPLYVGNSAMGSTLSATNALLNVQGVNTDYAEIPLDGNRAFQYLWGGSILNLTGGLTVRPRGYRFDR